MILYSRYLEYKFHLKTVLLNPGFAVLCLHFHLVVRIFYLLFIYVCNYLFFIQLCDLIFISLYMFSTFA